MKKRPTEKYVIIGTAHLGLSTPILKTIATFADHFNAKVIHVGPICTLEEKKMYEHRIQKVRTWEAIEERNSQIEELYQRYKKETDVLVGAQRKRVSTLRDIFGSVRFVSNSEVMLPDAEMEGLLEDEYSLCKYLTLSSVPANGDKVTGNPVTPRTVLAMREYATSVIMAHPIPATTMYRKEGVNCAYMFASTGSLISPEKCKRVSDIYKQILKPAFLFVGIDQVTQEFHCQRIRVKSSRCDVMHRIMPHISYDGLVFTTASGVKESSSKDKAAYITDVHAPHHAQNVLDCFHQLIKLHEPSLVLNGGDCSDFASVSRHTEFLPGSREGLRISDDLTSMWHILNDHKNACDSVKKVICLDSNHAEWLTSYVQKNNALIGLLDWPTLAKTYFADFEIIIRNGSTKAVWFGDLAVRHGDQEKSLMDAHLSYRNYVGGHYHSYSELGDAVRVGCAAQLEPGYLGGNQTAWQWMITTMTKHKEVTDKHPRIVLNSKTGDASTFMYQGQIFEIQIGA